MVRRPGHELCWTCPTCGLTNCPDCDSEGRSCPIEHPGETLAATDPRKRRRPVKGRERGANTVEYALIVVASVGFALAAAAVGNSVGLSSVTLFQDEASASMCSTTSR